MHISVVTPVYGCKDCLHELKQRLIDAIENITQDYEIIFVDDNCPQDSWSTIKTLSHDDKRIKGLKLSTNHGQHFAITAGLDYASGDWIVVMDCDLQDLPEEIPKLYKKAQDGYDIVVGQRIDRKDSFFKKTASKLFYATLSYLTDTSHDTSIANFGIYSKKAINSINLYRERNRLFPLLVKLVGFKKIEMPVAHSKRTIGETSYDFSRMLNLAVDAILAHSNKPLRLSIKMGFFIALSSSAYAAFLIMRYFIIGSVVTGWTSVMVSMFIMFGFTICILGIIGLYIGKIFDEVKNRPLYILSDTINIENNETTHDRAGL